MYLGIDHITFFYFVGTVCVMVSFPFLFMLCLGCQNSADWAKFIYYAPFVAIFQIGWASTQISHLSLIPSLTPNTSEKVELNAIRYISLLNWQKEKYFKPREIFHFIYICISHKPASFSIAFTSNKKFVAFPVFTFIYHLNIVNSQYSLAVTAFPLLTDCSIHKVEKFPEITWKHHFCYIPDQKNKRHLLH